MQQFPAVEHRSDQVPVSGVLQQDIMEGLSNISTCSALLEEERQLMQQLEVITKLHEEDDDRWKNERIFLTRKIEVDKKLLLDEIESSSSQLRALLVEKRSEESALLTDVVKLRGRFSMNNTEAEEKRHFVDKATSKLDDAKKAVLQLLQQFPCGVENGIDRDEELAQFVTSTVAQRNKMQHLHDECEVVRDTLGTKYDDAARERKLLHNEVEDLKGNIRVLVRLRPCVANDNEAPVHSGVMEDGTLELDEHKKTVFVSTPTLGTRAFEYYGTFGPADDSAIQQGLLFEQQIKPLIVSVFDGYNVSVVAYGQTGSGKTFTILGPAQPSTNLSGVLPQSIEYLLDHRKSGVVLSLTMVELYMDQLHDLLSIATEGMSRKCELRQNPGVEGVSIVGALEVILDTWPDSMQLIQAGIAVRQTHKTLKNATSSRSHLILTLHVESTDKKGQHFVSKLVFCDLAGSERVSRSLSQGDRLKEAQHINKSLSALGDVMHALSSVPRAAHIPYRNSRLTQLLQSSIGGKSKTLMIACISPHLPAQHNLVETISTLQFASRTRLIRNEKHRRSL